MDTPVGRRRSNSRVNAEDQALDQIAKEGEARLAAIRQARAEAREIRMRELERKHRAQEVNADRAFDLQQMVATTEGAAPAGGVGGGGKPSGNVILPSTSCSNALLASRIERAVTELASSSAKIVASSSNTAATKEELLQGMSNNLQEVRDCFRSNMVELAQLDNDRTACSYQIELLKDSLNDVEEEFAQLQREYRDKCKDREATKRENDKLLEEIRLVQGQLMERDSLIAKHGLIIVTIENEDGTDAHRALVSNENADLLGSATGSLDTRLQQFAKEKTELQAQLQSIQEELKDIKSKGRRSVPPGGGDDDFNEDALRDANKQINEYRNRLQSAMKENGNLQASLARAESLVIRFRSTAEASERAENELKLERRKLQREKREAEERADELETTNNHLRTRLEKMRSSKNALLKSLDRRHDEDC
uniref:Leucine-rich repeat flightless-interacting protein 2 n=1 Tax=Anopheles darlingi TaxID=43151 RepID=A0A2M4CS47_ANODA